MKLTVLEDCPYSSRLSFDFSTSRHFRKGGVWVYGNGMIFHNNLRDAIKASDQKSVTAILKKGVNLQETFTKGWSALHLASKAGNLDIVRVLLDYGAAVNATTELWRTPLDEAVHFRHEPVADLLRQQGGKRGIEITLQGAIASGNLAWVKKHLAAGAELNHLALGELPLGLALARRQWDIAKYLLSKKPDVTRTQSEGDTPLHIAVENCAPQSLLKVILRLGADVNALNKYGQSPLSLAARVEDEAAVKFLIAHGANPKSGGVDDISPVSEALKFLRVCRDAADSRLEKYLLELCLDPSKDIESGPWYFPGLIASLREFKADFIQSKSAGNFTTALGQKVFEVLDYTAYCQGLTLIQGETRLGKSHAGRAWCEQHPGKARFVEVPSGNDEVTFFRDLARGLGLGNFLNYKVVQIRERVEYVLRTGDIILVLDEAQRLWPQTNFREGYPKRIAWVMTMANDGVPICMISTPQFFVTQKVVEKNGWNSAQLTGRINHYESLPQALSQEDLIGVAMAVLPEADVEVLRALAVYAQSSARYLAAIDSIAKRARYIAMRERRDVATAGDVRRAMKESVVPADTKLLCALGSVAGAKLPKIKPAPMAEPVAAPELAPEATEEILPAARRGVAPAVPGSRRRAGNSASLIEA